MTHDEEYLMLEETHIGAKCNGIGAIKYEYDATYEDRFGIKHIYGKTLREISWQLDNYVSPTYNTRGIRVDKVERDGGPVVDFYIYDWNPRTEHWTRKLRKNFNNRYKYY